MRRLAVRTLRTPASSLARAAAPALRASRLVRCFANVPSEQEEVEPLSVPEAEAALRDAIKQNLVDEKANAADVSSELSQYLAAVGGKVERPDEKGNIVMHREQDGYKITVKFSKYPDFDDMDFENEQQQEENLLPSHTFLIDIEKNGAFLRIRARAERGEGDFSMQTIRFDDKEDLDAEEEVSGGIYVEDLSQDAQEALWDFLDSLQINQDLAQYVQNQALLARMNDHLQGLAKFSEFLKA